MVAFGAEDSHSMNYSGIGERIDKELIDRQNRQWHRY